MYISEVNQTCQLGIAEGINEPVNSISQDELGNQRIRSAKKPEFQPRAQAKLEGIVERKGKRRGRTIKRTSKLRSVCCVS